jgi:hypothetical protein
LADRGSGLPVTVWLTPEDGRSHSQDLVVPDLLFARELHHEFGDRLCGLGIVIEALDGGEVTTVNDLIPENWIAWS